MAQHLQQMVNRQVREILERDSASACPVVQSVSLFFWQHLARWSRPVSLSPAPFTIALAGPSGSGKSFIRKALVDRLSAVSDVSAFTQDNYYRDFSADFPHLPLSRFYDEINFDDPAHIRFRRLADDLLKLRSLTPGDVLPMPKLRFGTPDCKPSITEQGHALAVAPFIVTEGIHAFHDPAVLACYDLKIYVDIDETVRRERWLARNQRENRGVTDNMWRTTVDCLHHHILPTRPLADVVVNNAASREAVTTLIDALVSALAAPLEPQERREIA